MFTMKLFMKFGLFFSILILTTGCHTIVLVDENEEEAVIVEEEIIEPSPVAQIILDLTPFLFRELILNSELHPHYLPPVIHGHKSPAGAATHTDKQRSTQTGTGHSDSSTQSENRQNTRDTGARRGGR
jgi:hypothetical protein